MWPMSAFYRNSRCLFHAKDALEDVADALAVINLGQGVLAQSVPKRSGGVGGVLRWSKSQGDSVPDPPPESLPSRTSSKGG